MVSPVLLKPQQVFAFNDGNIEGALSPALKYPGLLVRVWENQFFFGTGSAGIPITTWSLLETLLGPHHYRREGVLIAIWFTGLAGLWTLRQFGCGRWAAFLGSLLLMLCGWNLTFPMNGLTARAFTLAWSAMSLGMLERARRTSSWLCYAVAGGFLGLAVSDTPDVGLLFAGTCALYFLATHFLDRTAWNLSLLIRNMGRFAVYVASSLLIAYQMVAVMFATQIAGVSQGQSESPREKYLWATQWSMPIEETWSLIAPDFHGASSRSADAPYWGGMGRSEGWEITKQGFRNYRLAGYAIGAAPVALLVFLFACMRRSPETAALLEDDDRRRIWILSLLALMSLMLSWGKHFFLYGWFYALPYMSTIRNPDKWLGPFSLCLVIVFAFAVDALCRARSDATATARQKLFKTTMVVMAVLGGLALLVTLSLMTGKRKFVERLAGMDFGEMAMVAWQHAVAANIQTLIVIGLVLALLYLLLRPESSSASGSSLGLMTGLCFLVAVPLLWAGRPFIMGHSYAHILMQNPLTSFLDQHRTEGRLKLIPAQHPLLNHWRMTMLLAKGYDLFDPVSVSRMPNDYQALFTALGSQPQRLWELGAVRYFLCTADVVPELLRMGGSPSPFTERLAVGVTMIEGGYVPTVSAPPEQRLVRLVEFNKALPMYRLVASALTLPDTPEGDQTALQILSQPEFDPARQVVLQGAEGTRTDLAAEGAITIIQHEPATAALKVSVPAPGLLVRAVKFHPDWRVAIDGQPGRILRANYLFQAVELRAGSREVVFEFLPSQRPLHIALAGRAALLLGLCAVPLSSYFRRKRS